MASNSGGGGFQRGGRPAPAPAGGDFFGIAALVFGVGVTIMLVAAIAAMYISSKSEDAVATQPEPEMTAPLIAEEPEAAAEGAESEAVGEGTEGEAADEPAPAEAAAP
ncbi:MAG: hypothetical protein ACK4IS_05270 [Erythrobacter sp.]